MKKNINYTVVFLFTITIVFGILSFFIAFKLKENKSKVGITKTKASSQTYKKVIQLDSAKPSPTPVNNSFLTPTQQPQTPTPSEAVIQISPTSKLEIISDEQVSETLSPTKKPVTQLPQSGNLHITSIVFFTALGLIFFSFIL